MEWFGHAEQSPLEANFRRSIVFKLTLFVAVLVAATTIIVGAVGYRSTREALLNEKRQMLSMLADHRADDLRTYILQQEERLTLIASRTRLRDLVADRVNGVENHDFLPETQRILLDAQQAVPSFLLISVVDRAGRVLTSTGANEAGRDHHADPTFVAGLAQGTFGIPPGEQQVADVAVPILSHAGESLGVAMARIDVSELTGVLKHREGLGVSGEIMIGAQSGDRVRRLFSTAEALPHDQMPAMSQAFENRKGFAEVVDYRGIPVMAAYTPVGYGGWGLVAKVDQAEGFAPIYELRRKLWILLGGVLLVGMGSSYLLARQFAKPIKRLAHAAAAVAAGDLSSRVEVRGRDELGLASATFNHMVEHLSASQRLLEQHVADRTQALAQSEKELRERTTMLSSILEGMGDGVVVCDSDGKFLVFNPAAQEILGTGRASLDPSEWSQHYRLYRPDGKSPFPPEELPLIRATRGESTDDVEIRVRRPASTNDTWIRVSGRPLTDDQGAASGGIAVFGDITESKQATEDLRVQSERTRRIIDSALNAFVSMDAAGKIIDWNEQSEVTFGWSREEALGRGVAELFIPERFRDAHALGLDHFLKTGQGPILDRRIELSAVHRDGHEFPVEITVSALRVGESYQFNAFLHDISSRKLAEEELRQAKTAAESANQSKSLFLANMSHEIRTPMNAIIGMTGLVLDTPLEADQREYLTMVQESGDSLLRVIEDILDFSKIEAGKLHIDRARFGLRESLGDALKTLGFRAHGKNLELACHIRTDVPDWFFGDSGRLRQVVVNLVGNAIKFTSAGEVVVDVLCREHGEDTAQIEFRVMDTGIGIPREKLRTIFEAFEQADTSTTRRYGGTGLGLAISTRLVELMGGDIRVESELGHGTTFIFTLPLDLAPPGPAPAKATSDQLTGMRVLIVDDNGTNRRILEEMVYSWSMEPHVADSAAEGLRLLAEASRQGRPIRLILTDAHMPDMDGFQFAEQVSRDPALDGAIIMMLTSGDRPEDIPRCERVGIVSYLIKPVKQSELYNAIATVIGADDLASHDRPESRLIGAARRPLDILLVEDSLVNQRLAIGLLGKHGHRVDVANNGREALATLEDRRFDVVLMDIQMPEMDGYEATAAIRRREQQSGQHVPIIAMTAHAMKGDREHCLEAGMDDYISKPIRADKLFALLDKFVPGSQPASTTAPPAEPPPTGDGPLDWSLALDTVDGDEELLRELAGAFLIEYPRLLKELRQGLAGSDARTVRRAAHTMRSSMHYFGAAKAYSYCSALEAMGERGAIDEARGALDPLLEQLDQLAPLLREFAENGRLPPI